MSYEIPSQVRIGLDVDGVLAGFMNAFVRRAKKLGIDFYEHHTEWGNRIAMSDEGDGMSEAFSKVWNTLDDGFWRDEIQPLEKAFVNFPVAGYFTARGSVKDGLTESWLELHGFPKAPVYKVGRSTEKEEFLIDEEIDFFVDDKPSTVIGLQSSHQYDGEAIIMTRPDNIQFDSIEPRIHYLTQVPKLIKRYEQLGYFAGGGRALA